MNVNMSEKSYIFFALFSLFGVVLSYVIPIIGNLVGNCIVCFSNIMIISIVFKKQYPTNHIAVPTVEVELT